MRIIILLLLICTSSTSFSQVLLEDKNGDVIVRNQFRKDDNVSLIKLNTGDQSLGFNYIKSTKNQDENNYLIHEFGIKAKPTEGYAAVFNSNQFSPGVKFSYALTKLRIFSADIKSGFIDWASVEFNYNINKYTLYRSDTTFSNQFSSQSFKPLSFLLHYNYLIQKGDLAGKLLISAKAGYSRSSNFDDLRSVEIHDIKTIIDPATSTARQIIKNRTGREGKYEEFDSYPLTLAITLLTQTDPRGSDEAKKLRLGFNGYIKSLATKINKPETNAGVIFFLTRQDEKNGIRNPVFGLNIQADDPFDVQDYNNGLQNRISIGFTSIFSL